jgi:hypothetical protein
MTRGNQDFQLSLKSHPVVLMGDLAYSWVRYVRWSKNDAIHWLDSTGLLLQTTGCTGRLFCCKNDNVFY